MKLRHYVFLISAFAAVHMPHAQAMQVPRDHKEFAQLLDSLKQQYAKKVERVTPFVHEQLGKAGCSNPESASVVPFDQYAASTNYGIFVPIHELDTLLKEKEHRKLETAEDFIRFKLDLTTKPPVAHLYREIFKSGNALWDAATLQKEVARELEYHHNRTIGTLHHEAEHYKNNDQAKQKKFNDNLSKATTAIDVGTMVTCAAAAYSPNNEASTSRCANFVVGSLLSRAFKPVLSNAYVRELEWRADENKPEDPKVLRACAEEFRRDNRDARRRLKQIVYPGVTIDLMNTDPIVNAVWSQHPRDELREQRLIERAEAIEQGKPRPAPSKFRSCTIS